MRPNTSAALILVLIAGLVASSPAWAWSSQEHREITGAAVRLLDPALIEVLQKESDLLVRSSVQPDLMRPREMPLLRELEAPRHYIDLELLQGQPLPESASEYLKLIARLADEGRGLLRSDWRLETIGILPYSVVESTQRLAAIFAQLRRQPENSDLRAMARYQAGIVAHYAQDLCQPLHTTIHHDGRARSDGSSPGSGIHRQVDSLLRAVTPGTITGTAQELEDLHAAVVRELLQSHSLVARVYELAGDLEHAQDHQRVSFALHKFGEDRYERAVRFTANLIYTAWLQSRKIDLPRWSDPQ